MSLDKRIITHEAAGSVFSNGYIFTSRYDRSLSAYQKLADIAKADFPGLKDTDIECLTVQSSSYMKGFPYVHFPLPAHAQKDGYHQCESADWS